MKIKNRHFRLTLIVFIFTLAILVSPSSASAHQPRLVSGDKIVEIENPEVSQAFYGNLDGQPAVFEMKISSPIMLYAGLLVPDLPNIKKDISASVTDDNDRTVFILDGPKSDWQKYYEGFAGDNYYKGPESAVQVEAGIYRLKVYSPTDQGKYVLVVGQEEVFPPNEILKTLMMLPKLKKDFFQKSPLTIFFSKIGLFLSIPIFVLIVIIIFIIFRKKIKRSNEPTIE